MSGRRLITPITLFVITCVVGGYLTHLAVTVRENEQRRITQKLLSTQTAEIERTLSHTLSSTYILAQEIIHSGGKFGDFKSYAAGVLRQFPGISNLQLAPNGVIREIYPLEGNESAIGHNILRDDKRKEEALLAISSQGLTLAGPFELVQGGMGVIGRNPVFIQRGPRKEFWGFASALIMIDSLLDRSGLATLHDLDFSYKLIRINPETNVEENIASGGKKLGWTALSSKIVVPNGTWILRVENTTGGGDSYRLGGYLLSLLMAVVIATFSYRVITEPEQLRKKVEIQTNDLHKLAYHDSLTGLPNRLFFSERLAAQIKNSATSDDDIALLLIDLDHFKEINDNKGHDYGDMLLVQFAKRIQEALPSNATLFRLGGDEFVISLTGSVSREFTETLAKSIINSLAQPITLKSYAVNVSCSIGLSMLNHTIQNLTDLLKCADLAMYEAKNRGRAGYYFFSDLLQNKTERRMRLTNDLKDAIDRNELKLLYQPIFCYKTQKIQKAEALVRWEHPELGTINPLEFIPLAENSGCIVSIGDWIFRTAADQAKLWQTIYTPLFQVSINVSPLQFRSEGNTDSWIAYLNEIGLDGSSILVEITEGILLDNNSDIQKQFNKLRSAGVKLALDDFGTGYSSLSYLKIFPIDYLKIDKSYIQNLERNNEDMFLCETIIKIASKFGLEVVAEGVETLEQYQLLTEHNCHFAQGYYFSQPISVSEFEEHFLSDPIVGYTFNAA